MIVRFQCSSASRKFLNRQHFINPRRSKRLFQCSSASRKFLNSDNRCRKNCGYRLFQCSSASRKFLNQERSSPLGGGVTFQCSSASRKFLNCSPQYHPASPLPKFQCSSASRKFLNQTCRFLRAGAGNVSVLFSEPKIPQCYLSHSRTPYAPGFSALQRAENSSISDDGVCFAC